jgi:hypothetical protein
MYPDTRRSRLPGPLPEAELLDEPRCPGAVGLVVLAVGMALWLSWVTPLGADLALNPLSALMAIVLLPVACGYAVPIVLLPWLALQGLRRLIASASPQS